MPVRAVRSEAGVRARLFALAASLLIVVLGACFLLVPPEWTLPPAVFYWTIPSLIVGLAVPAFAVRAIREHLHTLEAEASRWRELAAAREAERDSAQGEIVRRLQQERELGRQKVQFEAQLAAYEKYAALAQLALGAAHEINNPLLGISSHLELELKQARDAEQKEEIEQCIAGTRRISSTIHALINYARPGPLQLGKIHLGRLIDDTIAFLHHQPLFRRLHLQTDIAPETPAITADANQLSQILMNLLLNAAQATPDGGTISVSVHKIKFTEAVELTVTDTGDGIPADILPHVFEPFFTTKRGQGTGLGLSISQAYVRSHGGDIRVDSLPSRGTTVRITLPIRQEKRVGAREQQEELVV